jgi:hypothetical protein
VKLCRTVAIVALFPSFASAQVPAGSDFRVNTYTTGGQLLPRVSLESDADFTIVWTSDQQDGSGLGAFGQRFDASGARRGAEFRLNTYTTGNQGIPVAASGRRGDLVTVWQEDPGITARRYDANGAPIGTEFQVASYTTGTQYRPHVARGRQPGFVVTWASEGPDGSALGIAARVFDGTGSPVGPELVVNSYTTGIQSYPHAAVTPAGNFVVVWQDRAPDRDGSGTAIFGQRYTAAGAPIGGEFRVNTYTTGDQRFPSVSASAAGGFVVAWTGPDGSLDGVFARRYDQAGNPVANDLVVSGSTLGPQATGFEAVAHDERGNFVIVWQSAGARFTGQRFDFAGARRGSEFLVNTNTTGILQAASVSSDAVGNFVVTWQDYGVDGSQFGAAARRFGGLVPVGLRMTTVGPEVIRPGGIVAIHPTWRNVTGSAQTLSGLLHDSGGPPGGIPAIFTWDCNYGTVAHGASEECDYELIFPDPNPRPVQHWDATAVETIIPDVQGQEKVWTLHVGNSFGDVTLSNPFYRFIETLLHHGVTGGCTGTTYCPLSNTSREQMAVFVLVGKEGAGYAPPACGATPVFADVPVSSPFCRWIEELARRGVVSGCGGGNYCPTSNVTREQMSVFVLRMLDPTLTPPACTTPMFNDVPASSGFCRWIEELARRGVVTGCGGGNYCPLAAVTREQMGVFIGLTFGLTLYGP